MRWRWGWPARDPHRELLLLASLAAMIGCSSRGSVTADTSALEGRVAALEKRVDALDRRLASASASASASTSASSAAAASAWSCAAKCVTKFHCSTNGDNNVTWTNVTSVGGTAVDAFKSLDDQCDDILYVQGQCSEGSFVRTEATLANACVRN